jgi:hypothetical protein
MFLESCCRLTLGMSSAVGGDGRYLRWQVKVKVGKV